LGRGRRGFSKNVDLRVGLKIGEVFVVHGERIARDGRDGSTLFGAVAALHVRSRIVRIPRTERGNFKPIDSCLAEESIASEMGREDAAAADDADSYHAARVKRDGLDAK